MSINFKTLDVHVPAKCLTFAINNVRVLYLIIHENDSIDNFRDKVH